MTADFDIAAASYDVDFTDSAIGKAQRTAVHDHLKAAIGTELKNVLEVNCGTGRDAAFIKSLGHNIVATDASLQMILEAGLQNPSTDFRQMRFDELTAHFSRGDFDFIFSNFGGLNCIDASGFERFLSDCHELLQPKGKLLLVIMPRNTLWERWYFLMKCDRKSARRRLGESRFEIGGKEAAIYYYNPSDVKLMAKKCGFQIRKTKPIGLFVPPSYLEPNFCKMPRTLRLLERLDRAFAMPFLARNADHFSIELEQS